MISWHNAPSYRYNGYRYMPEVDEDDEGIRKAWHYVYKVEDVDVNDSPITHKGMTTPSFHLDHTPYHWLTYDEFTYHIDMLTGEMYDER